MRRVGGCGTVVLAGGLVALVTGLMRCLAMRWLAVCAWCRGVLALSVGARCGRGMGAVLAALLAGGVVCGRGRGAGVCAAT